MTSAEAPDATSATTGCGAPLDVLVGGASGFLGTPFVRHLRHRRDRVRVLVRRAPTSPDEVRWDPGAGELPAAALDGVDVVVNLGGAGLGAHRWTAAYKRTILDSRTSGAGILARAVSRAAAVSAQPPRLLQAGAVGYYGDRGEEVLTESSGPGTGFLAEVCQAWEAAAEPAREAGAEVVLLRTGLPLAPNGGALGPLMPLVRLGLGGPLGNGHQWWPWISLPDYVRALLHLVDSTLTGPVNLAAPRSARNGEIVTTIAHRLGRPALLPAPRVALRAAVGEFAEDILSSQRLVPQALLDDGFTYYHPGIADAADWIAGHSSPLRRIAGLSPDTGST